MAAHLSAAAGGWAVTVSHCQFSGTDSHPAALFAGCVVASVAAIAATLFFADDLRHRKFDPEAAAVCVAGGVLWAWLVNGGDAAAGASSPAATYRIIFKNGDDMRQDQLIIQMIRLMDQQLKRVGLDLQLTPYRVLAMSTRSGVMEMVLSSMPVSVVLAKYRGDIMSFFRAQHPREGAEYGIDPAVMDTYVKSAAGYAVITYLLGIGDRHLDNIMLRTDGHLFHLDFGYILGRDPKPFPAPIRLTKDR